MGAVIWNRDEHTGQGCYLAEMSIFSPEHIRLVEQTLIEGPAEGMTGRQVWEALARTVPDPDAFPLLHNLRDTPPRP